MRSASLKLQPFFISDQCTRKQHYYVRLEAVAYLLLEIRNVAESLGRYQAMFSAKADERWRGFVQLMKAELWYSKLTAAHRTGLCPAGH